MDPAANQKNKGHRAQRPTKKPLVNRKGQNAKAFAVARPGKRLRQVARAHDVLEKKLHAPAVDRTPDDPPPVIVAVVGPPGTGKTTLIKSLVRRFTKQTLVELKGPVTVVSGKHRRLTFIECANDLSSMMDIAKIADLVLLLIDGNFGFEMETMEFLNLLAPHGLPKILGVLTHLDLFKSATVLRTAKKRLKRRFWTEIYQGAKLFYLSGVLNGRYPDREVLNLSRFISVMKFRPLTFRSTHSYLLADRIVDITHPATIEANAQVDRSVCFYGYIQGTNMAAKAARIHIPGVGDYTVSEISTLPDPCPTPQTQKAKGRKRLGERDKLIYAPMSDVGGVMFDKDSVYINVPEKARTEGLGERLLEELKASRKGLGESAGEMQMFTNGAMVSAPTDSGRTELRKHNQVLDFKEEGDDLNGYMDGDADNDDDIDGDADDGASDKEESDADDVHNNINDGVEDESANINGKAQQRSTGDHSDSETEDAAFAESDSDLMLNSDDEEALEDRDSRFVNVPTGNIPTTFTKKTNINRLIYDEELLPEQVVRLYFGRDSEPSLEDQDDNEFFTVKPTLSEDIDVADSSFIVHNHDELRKFWSTEEAFEDLRQKFAIGMAENEQNGEQTIEDDDEDLNGDFEDLEAEESDGTPKSMTLGEERAVNAKKKLEARVNMKNDSDSDSDKELEWHEREKLKLQKQVDLNRLELEKLDEKSRIAMEGFRAGTYVRLVIPNVPAEFIKAFDPHYPVIVGSLSTNEERFGFLQVRIKRHRWHKKILKTNDPLIFSLGWRRFQSIPIYTLSDSRTRNRMLKYTPEHMHCFATLYGPLIAPNTGFCAVQSVANKAASGAFRIAATGVVLSVEQKCEIVKKLKLTGVPYQIYKNTAFVKDMFNSTLEVAKFEGAAIRTVSGVRGHIKRALSNPEGHFRATFEDKVLMSDIVFLRAWHQVQPRKFYNPVTSLLQDEKSEWTGMRLTGQVRHDQQIPIPVNGNSKYRKIERETRHFNPLKVPKHLQALLPYASKVREQKSQRKPTYMQSRAVVLGGKEKVARDLMLKMTTLRKEKIRKRREQKAKQRETYQKKVDASDEKRKEREKREAKDFHRREGKKRKRMN